MKGIRHHPWRWLKTIRHVEMWAKNAFDEWWEFWGFNTKKSIANMAEDGKIIMELMDMLAMFICQVAKKDKILVQKMC